MRLAIAILLVACGGEKRVDVDAIDAEARAKFPDLPALYDGEQGLYRGCGPNGGVCHNGNEFPNLDSLGSIVANIDIPCNQKREMGIEIDDMCERRGDRVQFGDEKVEIAYLEPWEGGPTVAWRMVLRHAPAMLAPQGEPMQVWRDIPGGGEVEFVPLSIATVGYLADPDDPSGTSILLGLPQEPGPMQTVTAFFQESGTARPDRLHFGDPNRNHAFGADLGARLVKPGDPEKSYLLRRLVDPTMGPLMPRANCCSWTKASLRALWCWVDGLAPDGSNALEPIDYDTCRASPPVDLLYPEPGEMCEAQGLCPVQAGGGTGDATFASIYSEVLTRRCAGDGCHDTGAPGGVDLRTATAAFETLSARVVPGDPDASPAYRRLDPALCTGTCKVMPLDRPALAAAELARLRQRILDGAPEE
jgi:hypothetical protein